MTAETGPGRPLVVVTVGSDHHRFDRLIRWLDGWLAGRTAEVDCVVQHGTADPPRHGAAVDYLEHERLQRLMSAATVVVAQGGPMSIVEARRHGRLPIVVPRTAALGEVVDDHQHAFCERLAEHGMIHLAGSESDLHVALDAALAAPESFRAEPGVDADRHVAAAVERIARIADGVLEAAPGDGPRVLMLGGFGRSGSTLLERCLGEVPGVAALGEVLHLWQRGLADDELCGCGSAFSRCEFWQLVGKYAFGGWDAIDTQEALADRHEVVRSRRIPALVTGLSGTTRRLRRRRLRRRVDAVYRAAADAAGARLLVDSSKHPAYAHLLRRASVTLRCVLVVRDPRGVAHSWSKTVVRPEVSSGDVAMPQYSPLSSAVRWSWYSVAYLALRVLRVPVLVVRYEDLVARPHATLRRVLRFAGMDAPEHLALDHVAPAAVRLGTHHTVAGNPMRFRVGTVDLRLDEDWRQAMRPSARRVVGAVTAPLRLGFRYWRGGGPGGGSGDQPGGESGNAAGHRQLR